MGADFIFAAAEMPAVPTIEGKGLYHDDAAKDAIVERLRTTIYTNRELLTDLLQDDYYDVLEENASILGIDEASWWDDDKLIYTCAKDVFTGMENDLRQWWNGSWGRDYTEFDTYNSKGEKITLTVAGDMSWGDSTEMCMVLWRFARLPEGWFKGVN